MTQTDMFATVVTGAPLTNLMSMYNILYKGSGSGNGPILEWSQGRFGVTPWDDFELYRSQSPVHHADKITTPFLILHGTADGAVDWNQGLEFFTAARRLAKEVIPLSYPDEPHHLGREANQKDFQVRMRQYFDHHLKGLPAPEWMEKGAPHVASLVEANRPGRCPGATARVDSPHPPATIRGDARTGAAGSTRGGIGGAGRARFRRRLSCLPRRPRRE